MVIEHDVPRRKIGSKAWQIYTMMISLVLFPKGPVDVYLDDCILGKVKYPDIFRPTV